MLAGRTVTVGGHSILVSPARVRVARYVKGTGPLVVSVVTGVTQSASGTAVSEDGIQPEAGQQWQIYTSSTGQPFQTSICDGTRPISHASK